MTNQKQSTKTPAPPALGAKPSSPSQPQPKPNGSAYVPKYKGKRTFTVFGLSQKGYLVSLAYEAATAEDMRAATEDVFHDFETMKVRPFATIDEAVRGAIQQLGAQVGQLGGQFEQLGGEIEQSLSNGEQAQSTPQGGSHDGAGEYRAVKILRLKLLYSPNGNPYILVQGLPGLAKHGLNCWKEVYEPVFGKTEDIVAKYGGGKEIPIPDNAAYAIVFYKNDKAEKVVEFRATAN